VDINGPLSMSSMQSCLKKDMLLLEMLGQMSLLHLDVLSC